MSALDYKIIIIVKCHIVLYNSVVLFCKILSFVSQVHNENTLKVTAIINMHRHLASLLSQSTSNALVHVQTARGALCYSRHQCQLPAYVICQENGC
jgi:hypothetical protein